MAMNQTPRKNADVRVPPVTDDFVEHPFSLWRFLSYVMTFVLLFLLVTGSAFWGITLFRRGHIQSSPMATTVTPVATTPAISNKCLDQASMFTDQSPALFFCSPQFMGNISGPFGVHIVLVGVNFPSVPTRWLLHVNPFKNNTAPENCTNTMQNDCLILPPPTSQTQLSHTVFQVVWTWKYPFPYTLNNYFISAQIKNKVFTTNLNFTLLSKQPPCITISVVLNKESQRPDCIFTSTPIVLSKNATIDIRGKNWLLGWNNLGLSVPADMTIHILATCLIPATCGQQLLFHIIISAEELITDGTFSRRISLADQAPDPRGTYKVSAWNVIPDQIMLDDNNTIANNVLGFGENSADLVLKIT